MVYIPSETVLILEKPTTRVEVVKLLEVWVVVRRKERKEGWERKLMGRGRSSRAEREERTRETFTLFAHSLPLVPGLEGERAEAPVEMRDGEESTASRWLSCGQRPDGALEAMTEVQARHQNLTLIWKKATSATGCDLGVAVGFFWCQRGNGGRKRQCKQNSGAETVGFNMFGVACPSWCITAQADMPLSFAAF